MTKSIDLDHITGKTPLIFKEIYYFPHLAGNLPFIFKHGKSISYFNKSILKEVV